MAAAINPESRRKKILLLYPYYWPTYKAGGPVQSLFNLVSFFKDDADFFLVSLSRDLDGNQQQVVNINTWTKGPNDENIYFTLRLSPFLILKIIREVRPDVMMLNGIFHISTTMFARWWARFYGIRVFVSPRGMLQEWALNRKKRLKQVYLFFFKLFLTKDSLWHATNQQEGEEIRKQFGLNQRIFVAPNVPRKVFDQKDIGYPGQNGKIDLVFLSLINPNKNLHLIIDALKCSPDKFTLDIYGPVIDQQYWDLCESKINNDPAITYKGPVVPWDVPEILSSYHFFVLPTQGENFGHAIFDALASGIPVIISTRTPWKDIETLQAGYYIDIHDQASLGQVLQRVSSMNPDEYSSLRKNSIQYAKNYWTSMDYHADYQFLFEINNE